MDFIQRAGLVQIFEFTFELGWKSMKDYLFEMENISANSPRQVIQQAVSVGLLEDGYEWIDALTVRNQMANTYSEQDSLEAESSIKHNYFQLLESLRNKLKAKL